MISYDSGKKLKILNAYTSGGPENFERNQGDV